MKTLCIDAFGARLLFSWEQLYNPFPAGGEIGQIIGPQKWLDKGYVIVPWRVTNPTYKGPSASGSTYKGPKKHHHFGLTPAALVSTGWLLLATRSQHVHPLWRVMPYKVMKKDSTPQKTNSRIPKMMAWKMYLLSNMAILGIYIRFQGGIWLICMGCVVLRKRSSRARRQYILGISLEYETNIEIRPSL